MTEKGSLFYRNNTILAYPESYRNNMQQVVGPGDKLIGDNSYQRYELAVQENTKQDKVLNKLLRQYEKSNLFTTFSNTGHRPSDERKLIVLDP